MWKKEQLIEDLKNLRIREGDSLIVHASLRQIGKVEGGAEAVLQALQEVVGSEGTLLVPAFNKNNYVNDEWIALTDEERNQTIWDSEALCIEDMGVLPDTLRKHPDAKRTHHPILSFAALGKNASYLTGDPPFHYPLGTNSPLARLYQLNGGVLLLGVQHTVNTALHLAEVWADVPYARRKAKVRTGETEWETMEGSPECSAGFYKIEPILRQARLLKEGYVGNAPSQYIRIQYLVSMAMEMMRGNPEVLLCDNPACRWCPEARKLSQKSKPLIERVWEGLE